MSKVEFVHQLRLGSYPCDNTTTGHVTILEAQALKSQDNTNRCIPLRLKYLPAVIPSSHISVSGSINALILSLTNTYSTAGMIFWKQYDLPFYWASHVLLFPSHPHHVLKVVKVEKDVWISIYLFTFSHTQFKRFSVAILSLTCKPPAVDEALSVLSETRQGQLKIKIMKS